MNQTERILRHLQTFGAITSLEAIQDYGILRLASRISELKKEGLPIQREMVSGQNRWGEVTSFARYRIRADEETQL